MNFIQPSIDPVILSFGFIDIRWYSLAYIFGLIFGLILIKRLNRIKGNLISINQLDNFFIWAVLGIVMLISGFFTYVSISWFGRVLKGLEQNNNYLKKILKERKI